MSPTAFSMTPRERLEHRALRSLSALPGPLQTRLSGRAPIVLDGDTLAPDIQLMISLLERLEPAAQPLDPESTRRERRRMARICDGPPVAVAAVSDLTIDAPHQLRARHYAPPEPGGRHPLMVFLHGGGFTFGDLDTHDGVCRMLCRHAGMHVLAIDYRLAPEHPFPAAVEDARRALAFAHEHAGALGADPQRVAIGGDSAGGNLAAVAAQIAKADGGPGAAMQMLIYPSTDISRRWPSRDLFGKGFLLTDTEMDWFRRNYLGHNGADRHDPRLSPMVAPDLGGLPPALVATAAFDPLRDEGEAYGLALRSAGTPVVLRRFPGLIHGFISIAGVSRVCRDAVIEIAGATRALLNAVPAGAEPSAGPGIEDAGLRGAGDALG